MPAHGVEQRQAVGEVGAEGVRRIRDRGFDGGLGRQVQDGVERALRKGLVEGRRGSAS